MKNRRFVLSVVCPVCSADVGRSCVREHGISRPFHEERRQVARVKFELRRRVVNFVQDERDRQDAKWGEQNHDPLYWHGVLTEEVGELAKEIIEFRNYEKELIEVAAVALAWLEAIQRCGTPVVLPEREGYNSVEKARS